MIFKIQAGNPVINTISERKELTLPELMEDVFSMDTDDAIMFWNHMCIPLSYKYDISYMIDDILAMLDDIQSHVEGSLRIEWLPDTFRCDWDIVWRENNVIITSFWERVVGNIANQLNLSNSVVLERNQFLREWNNILTVIIFAVKQNPACEVTREEYDLLINVYRKLLKL